MRTRSGSRTTTAEDAVEAEPQSAPSTEAPVSARPELQHEDSDSDDAPEEVTGASSRQAAAAQLREERLVAAQATKSMRDRRRQRFGSGKGRGQAEEEPQEEAGGAAPDANGVDEDEDDGSEEELDLLPSSVVSDLAQSRSDAVYREQSSVVSRHLRGAMDAEKKARNKLPRREDGPRARRAGPVTVQVLPEPGLDGARMAADTASAASFLGSRLGAASKVKRSMDMLGGVPGRGPAVRPKIRI